MAGRLEGKVAIVTGASRGMGRATAELFASEGARVAVNYLASEEQAFEVVKGINSRDSGYQRALAVKANVSVRDEVKAMVATVLERFGRIDILVNNAGVVYYSDPDGIDDSDLEEMFGVHVRGTIYCTVEVAKHMKERASGRIVNVASIASIGTALRGTTAYSATKAGVITLTRRFAFEYGKSGIGVNCVAPGFIETEMTRAGLSQEEWSKTRERISSRTLLNRIGTPLDVARATLFLSSEESSFITGQVLVVDGGRTDYLSHGP